MNKFKNQSLSILFLLFTFLGFARQESTVFIARNNGFAGSGAPAHIFVDYDYLGKLKNKNYIEYKTSESKLNIAVVSNLGSKRAISVSLEPQQTKYINVNLSKVYFLEDATEDEKLRSEVLDKVESKEKLMVSSSEKNKYLSKHKSKLDDAYAEFGNSTLAGNENGNTQLIKALVGVSKTEQQLEETNTTTEASPVQASALCPPARTSVPGRKG